MQQRISVGIFQPKYVDHLQRWSRIFRSEETEMDLSNWIPTDIPGIFDIIDSTLGLHFEKLLSRQSTVTFIHSLKCVYSSQEQNYISKSTIYLFPSMTSMRSSAVASYLRVMSALAMRYSLNMDLTESMSSSDWVHYDITAKTEYYRTTYKSLQGDSMFPWSLEISFFSPLFTNW